MTLFGGGGGGGDSSAVKGLGWLLTAGLLNGQLTLFLTDISFPGFHPSASLMITCSLLLTPTHLRFLHWAFTMLKTYHSPHVTPSGKVLRV